MNPHPTLQDESAASRVEDALRENEERYRTLFALARIAVYSCDVSGVDPGIQEPRVRSMAILKRTRVAMNSMTTRDRETRRSPGE